MAKTIAGLYDSLEEAREVRDALINAGFDRDDISIAAANSDERYTDFVEGNVEKADYNKYYRTEDDDDSSSAAEGALAGGLIGGAGAALLAVFIPGIGPFTATGWLLAGLVGLAGGAITGGILGALVDSGVDEDDAVVYSEGIRRGYTLVLVRADDDDASQVASIMNDHDAIDTDQRAAYWESEGWAREYDSDASVYNMNQIKEERTGYNTYLNSLDEGGTATVPVIEEELRVGKRTVGKDNVRIRTYVDRDEVEEQVTLTKESIDVDRRSVNREVSSADLDAFEEGVVEVTATAEEVVTDKVARVVEEVTIRKDVDQVTETVRDTVRRTGVDIDHTNGTMRDTDANFDDTSYRAHYDATYATSGRDYDYYEPHYRYGYALAGDTAYHGRGWDSVETDVRREWESRYSDTDSTWDDVRGAIHSGWMSVKRAVA